MGNPKSTVSPVTTDALANWPPTGDTNHPLLPPLSPKFVLWQTTNEGGKIDQWIFVVFAPRQQGKTSRSTHELLVALLLDDWLPHDSWVFCLDCFHGGIRQ